MTNPVIHWVKPRVPVSAASKTTAAPLIEKPSSNYNNVDTTMMKSKHSHNRFVRFVMLPIRALGKARDFYVRSMINCAEGRTYGQPMGGTLPKSFSARSALSSESDDYGELVRAASVRSMGHLNEIDMLLKQHMQMRSSSQQLPQQQLGSNGKARFPKSCSVGMAGFMGRIEEEKPGDLGEDGSVHAKTKSSDSVYARSRSVAVGF
ncbi:hypothetical protein KPL71_015925 [Citrus sinensis]|uniref:Uncharacterized protein n=1 Tax=Citrus sinensis TaxID=2711 RepID=A0ACB8KN83_CITSI|nr:hypothetical protein KPL71_015925 [Citrus sinensis]